MSKRKLSALALPLITSLVFITGGASVWFVPYLVSSSEPPARREQTEKATRDIWLECIKTSGSLAFIFTAYFAWRNLKSTEDKQITDRLSKAIEQIGSEVTAIQLGGIYCLKRLAEDSLTRDYFIVLDVLSELLRSSSAWPDIVRYRLLDDFYRGDANSQAVKNLQPEAISRISQVILEVLSR